jgi:hypothetical protein
MSIPAGLLVLSLLGILGALIVPGATDVLLLVVPSAIASLILWLRQLGQRMAQELPWVILDGSNVMHWRDNTPQIDTLREVVVALERAGFAPGIVFDANAGYKLVGQYLPAADLAAVLGLPKSRVMIVPRGEPADPVILTAARDRGVRIVTNDRFRDWADSYPDIATTDQLIRGGYRDGKLWLDL